MTITSTITFDDSSSTAGNGSPVDLVQDLTGHLFLPNGGKEVVGVSFELTASDTKAVINVKPDSQNPNHALVAMVTAVVERPKPLVRAETGGVTWSILGTTGQSIELTAPTSVGAWEYAFDTPAQPSVKLTVTVKRT